MKGGIFLEFSARQQEIITIVKQNEPISADEIGKRLGLVKATLRSDLAVLTMTGVLDAKPKVGYFYIGLPKAIKQDNTLFEEKVENIMSQPMLIQQETSIYEAVVTLFMFDAGNIYVTNESGDLVGVISRKDLLRATVNTSNLNETPIAMIMTRTPHVVTAQKHMKVLDVGYLLMKHKVDSIPIMDDEDSKKVIGKIGKTAVMEYFIQAGLNRSEE